MFVHILLRVDRRNFSGFCRTGSSHPAEGLKLKIKHQVSDPDSNRCLEARYRVSQDALTRPDATCDYLKLRLDGVIGQVSTVADSRHQIMEDSGNPRYGMAGENRSFP